MAKAAIDVDGTLAAWPHVLGPLTRALADYGWDVVLLTGHCLPEPDKADMAALLKGRQEQVAPFGAAYREIVICVGHNSDEVAVQKADYCKANDVNLLVDDSGNYCDAVRRRAPKTLVLQVRP